MPNIHTISFFDPFASMTAVDNEKLKDIAVQIRQKLEIVINTL